MDEIQLKLLIADLVIAARQQELQKMALQKALQELQEEGGKNAQADHGNS